MQTTTMNWRSFIIKWVENPVTDRFIISLIIINAVTLGLETSPAIMASYGEFITHVFLPIPGRYLIF